MPKETQTRAIKGHIASLRAEIQQKTETLKGRPLGEDFLTNVEIGLLVEEREIWEKWLVELKAA